jgi:hypothetical protein
MISQRFRKVFVLHDVWCDWEFVREHGWHVVVHMAIDKQILLSAIDSLHRARLSLLPPVDLEFVSLPRRFESAR